MLRFNARQVLNLCLINLTLMFAFASAFAAEVCMPPRQDVSTPKPLSVNSNRASANVTTFVFFDSSINMVGFVNPKVRHGKKEGLSYKDLALVIPHIVSKVGKIGHFHKFGKGVFPISEDDLSTVAAREFYLCERGTPLSACQSRESNLTSVLSLIESGGPESLFVVASDLFIDSKLLLDSRPGSLLSIADSSC